MDIKIKSSLAFDQVIYDKAYGFAKSVIQGKTDHRIRFSGDYAFTVSAKKSSCVVTIHKR